MSKLAHRLRHWTGASGKDVLASLLSPDQFRNLLGRERARSDRTGEPFALLTLGLAPTPDPSATACRLVKVLQKRLRVSDVAGWLDGQVCVLLPDTGAEGAWTLADAVCKRIANGLPPCCEVYVYPTGDGDTPGWPPRAAGARQEGTARRVRPLGPMFCRRLPWPKRALDFTLALLGLLALAPLLAVIAAAVKASSAGPVFFRQWRSGLGRRPFRMYKFRTMCADAEKRQASLRWLNEQDGPAFKIRNDPRVTPVGRFLRATSLDELPQLVNILLGDMSLVGPRPLPCDEAEQCANWQRRRMDVVPGLTCIWQVWGRSRVSFADWVRMDLRYIRAWSLWLDIKLLLRTIPSVVLRRGA
jgi:lipopolysaccharide/colanic/teichoic acid biosynthesis glycosyltransferase